MAELADALDLGSSGRPCRFDSCYPHAGPLGNLGVCFYSIGKYVLLNKKSSGQERTAAEWYYAAKAARRRRRIPRAGFFLIHFTDMPGTHSQEKMIC